MVPTIAEGRKGRKQGSGPASGVSAVASSEVEVLELAEIIAQYSSRMNLLPRDNSKHAKQHVTAQ
jgi:hypothetical protein